MSETEGPLLQLILLLAVMERQTQLKKDRLVRTY